jgi:hypothetical protein
MRSALRVGLLLATSLSQPVPSQAEAITHRFVDLTDAVQFEILVNNSVVFADSQGGESYSATVPLIAPLTAPLSLAANIFEPGGGRISDVFSAQGSVGGSAITQFFVSDTDGGPVLDPLPGAISLVENGGIQAVGTANLMDGSTLRFQFQSDVEAPEPSPFATTLTLFVALLGRRHRPKRGGAVPPR